MDTVRLFSKNPTYETDRLILRRLLPKDALDMYSYARRPETSEFLLWEPHPSLSYTEDLIRFLQKEYATGKYSDFAIILKDGGKMIGTVGFTSYDEKNSVAEVGYVISPDHWHKGIATEALKAILGIAFCELKVQRVEAKYMPKNVFSGKVMDKCGMTYEGTARSRMLVKGTFRDIAYCSILKDEFFARYKESTYRETGLSGVLRRLFEPRNKN